METDINLNVFSMLVIKCAKAQTINYAVLPCYEKYYAFTDELHTEYGYFFKISLVNYLSK